MPGQQNLEIQQGIWIERRLLQDAGLGSRLQVIVQPGEIRILAASAEAEQSESVEELWTEEAREAWRSLWQEAEPGQLHNPSENHDLYLYGKKE